MGIPTGTTFRTALLKYEKYIIAALFIVTFFGHVKSQLRISTDSRWVVHTAMSVIKEGNTDLDEYYEPLIKNSLYAYAVEKIGDHYYYLYPIGTPLLSIPFVFAADFFGYPVMRKSTKVEMRIASFFVAIATVFMALIARKFLRLDKAILVALVYSFCTSTWSTSSRALWQHGPSCLVLCAVLYLILLSEKKPHLIQYTGLLLALSYVIRPSNSLSIFILTAYVIHRHRRYVWKYALWAIAGLIPFFCYNFWIYGKILSPYYTPARYLSSRTFFEALAGQLVSPGRGLFVFSPVLLFSIVGIILRLKHFKANILDVYLILVIVLHWLAISTLKLWWGGHCFGPRLFTDMLPYLVYFLIPVFEKFSDGSRSAFSRKGLVVVFAVLVAFSFSVHWIGANRADCIWWNTSPTNIDYTPNRLWDWGDLQFLRGWK